MKAIVLAAGEGSRLRPHTLDRPKCLVELGGRPLLSYQAAALRRAGVDEIVLVTGYRGEQLRELGYATFHNERYAQTNMVASLMCAEGLMDGREDLLIAYADLVYEARVVERLISCQEPLATTVDTKWAELWRLRQEDLLDDAETLKLNADGTIRELGKQPSSLEEIEGQYMGLIKVSAAFAPVLKEAYHALLAVEARTDSMYMTSFLQHLVDAGHPLKAVLVEGGWLEVDTSGDLDRYSDLAKRGELQRYCRLPLVT